MPLPSCYSAVCPLALWMNLGNKEICKFITDFKELVYLFPCSLSLLSFDDVIYSIHCFIMSRLSCNQTTAYFCLVISMYVKHYSFVYSPHGCFSNWNVQALYLSLYRNFSNVLMERLPDASRAGTLQDLKSTHADAMAVDLEEPSAMELDNEDGRPKKRFPSPPTSQIASLSACNVMEYVEDVIFTLFYSLNDAVSQMVGAQAMFTT